MGQKLEGTRPFNLWGRPARTPDGQVALCGIRKGRAWPCHQPSHKQVLRSRHTAVALKTGRLGLDTK